MRAQSGKPRERRTVASRAATLEPGAASAASAMLAEPALTPRRVAITGIGLVTAIGIVARGDVGAICIRGSAGSGR